MSTKKKDLEKLLDKLAKRAVERALARVHLDDDVAMPGCFVRKSRRALVAASVAPSASTSTGANYVNIAYNDIREIIRARMPVVHDCVIKVCDVYITTYPEDVFLMFMDYANECHNPKYVGEQFDCDDFSIMFCATARKWHARISNIMSQHPVAQASEQADIARPVCAPGASYIVPRTHVAASTALVVAQSADSAQAAAAAATSAQTVATQIGGSPIGMCHGRLSANDCEHAFNFWISPSGEPIYIEPQTGEFVTFGSGAIIDFVYI